MHKLSPASILSLLYITVITMSLVSCGGDSDEEGVSYKDGEVRLSEDMVRAMTGKGTIRERNIKIAIGVGLGVLIIVAVVVLVKLDKARKATAGTYKAEHEGCTIELECNLKEPITGTFQYSLIIDNERVDTIQGSTGDYTLRGTLKVHADKSVAVVIKIHATSFHHENILEIDGVEKSMTKA